MFYVKLRAFCKLSSTVPWHHYLCHHPPPHIHNFSEISQVQTFSITDILLPSPSSQNHHPWVGKSSIFFTWNRSYTCLSSPLYMTIYLDFISSLWYLYFLTNYQSPMTFPIVCKLLLTSELIIPFSMSLSIFFSLLAFSYLPYLPFSFFVNFLENIVTFKMLKYIT